MSGHTPAPWAFLNHKGDESLLAFGIGSVEEMHDMDRYGWYSTWCLIKPEDARLIASAPDLLAALEDLADVAQVLRPETVGDEMDKEARIAYAQFAIAKARGEQP